jgi:hypothetical protein
MFGEAWANSTNLACDGGTQSMTQQSINGFLSSNLYTSDGSNVVLRPWENAASTDCPTPANLGPYHP